MSVENIGMCKVMCKDCKHVSKQFPWFDPDLWQCKKRHLGYSCVNGKSEGYGLCQITNENGDCQMWEAK